MQFPPSSCIILFLLGPYFLSILSLCFPSSQVSLTQNNGRRTGFIIRLQSHSQSHSATDGQSASQSVSQSVSFLDVISARPVPETKHHLQSAQLCISVNARGMATWVPTINHQWSANHRSTPQPRGK